MKLAKCLLISVFTLIFAACGDDITNVPAPTEGDQKVNTESTKAADTYKLLVNQEIIQPALSSGVTFDSDLGSCTLDTKLQLVAITFPKDSTIFLKLHSMQLQGEHDEILEATFVVDSSVISSRYLECELATSSVETEGMQSVLDSFSGEKSTVAVKTRKQIKNILKKIVFAEDSVDLPKLTRSVKMQNEKLGVCELSFKNVQDRVQTLPALLDVYKDSLEYKSDIYPKRKYYFYKAKFKDEFVYGMECELDMESADDLEQFIEKFYSSDDTKVVSIDSHM